jgi:TonB-dependent SusC/RagA subfamily outer membrane receptor
MYKKVYLVFLIFSLSFGYSQDYSDEWKDVYKYELNGQIQSAQKEVQGIYKKAKRKKNEVQIVKCFFYLSKFEQVVDEKAQSTIIKNLQQEIKEAKPVSKALLNYIYVSVLERYVGYFNYQIRQRTPLENQKNKDFLTWNSQDFYNEIDKTYAVILKDEKELRDSFLNTYKDIFEISPSVDAKNFSVYDFLSQKCSTYFKSKISSWKLKNDINYSPNISFFYDESKTFIKYDVKKLEDENLKKLILLLQNNEKFYLSTNKEKADYAYYERLKFIQEKFWDDEMYLKKIFALEKNTSNVFLKQFIRVDRAKFYEKKAYKNNGKNLYQDALNLIDTIINAKVNINALAEAEILRNDILRKSLNISLPKTIYSNQNTRAYVDFKNIDSLTVSYYQLPQKLNYIFESYYYRDTNKRINKDSIVNAFLSKNNPVKKQFVKLPNKNDYFNYTTEFLLDKLEIGNYLIYVESPNDSTNYKNAFAYERLQVTNLFIVEDDEKNEDTFFIYNQKTGKPIENVKVKNEEEASYSNSIGKALFKKKKYEQNKKYNSSLQIVFQNDTITKNYNRNFQYSSEIEEDEDEEYENFEAKAMVYYDRAIYRPGQKMYYKGVLIQKKDHKKSVVPFVTVHVSIYDVNSTVLKEFDVQTNEYGSFSGEFDIPKNTLTGDFYMKVEEPDDYENDKKYYIQKEDEHTFWDNVNFENYSNFYFKVEEYKRPTFEVKFDEIKENYTIGDTLKIRGNAKALAGNNLTNAKVAYTISKSTSIKNNYIPYQENFINTETTTDENGNFVIEFVAKDSLVSNEDIYSFNYTINVTVTDSNGETRTSSESVIVGKNRMKINLVIQNELIAEENNKVIIKATTLNDFPIDAKGELKIYELQKKSYLKNRLHGIPEIQGFTREEFQRLFPHEPYDNSDYETKEILVKTIPFDTKNSKEIPLDFLKNYRNTDFKIVAEAYDLSQNLITNQQVFEVKSKQFPYSEKELFTFKDITEEESKYYIVEIQSIIPDLHLTAREYVDNTLSKDIQTIQLINGKGVFKFYKNDSFKINTTFHFSSIWENQGYEKLHQIKRETIENKLQIEVESLRNKIEPASNENWSFKITNPKLEAEILASMYDSSLDQFTTKNWETIYFSTNGNYPNIPEVERYYQTFSININNFDYYRNFYPVYQRNPELNWFGFNFNNPKDEYVLRRYLAQISDINEIPENSKYITGIVSDELGPLPGATVVVKGTTRGTTTDFDGMFLLEAAKGETLVVSYVGFSDMKIIIDKRKEYEIKLNSNENQLESVVVVGYNSHKKYRDGDNNEEDGIYTSKSKAISASMTVTSESIEYRPNESLLESLQGNSPGLFLISSSGTPGSDKFAGFIRGNSSINGETDPLIVIDGLISSQDDFKKLLSNDLSSINILKGKEATSLYGNRGANGVIIITTKNALKELTQVKTRTNFNETAFFYPHLKTDSNGRFSFQFTTPESLTKWKLRVFAHNKNAETGNFETDIIAQKDVMIQTNMPRFVRENDTITLSAKVVNMTPETKSGVAMLMLYNATTMEVIDKITMNASNVKNFSCKPRESVPVSWTISIPEGLQGLQYKIVAKSGNFSDGEENILPVMSNKILLTESIPIWLKGGTKKEYTFENLLNNDSKTLKNHQFTLEYTSNPTWLALQALPYLMEYQHECAEQTFSRYYGNFIATEIISSNPKITSLFESWKNNPKAVSKLTQNEELKSIVLNETPWLLDAESEELKNKRLALLMDLNVMKDSQERTLKKLEEKQLSSGAFSWFDGGEENLFITQHIVSGLGHLGKMFPDKTALFEKITTKAIPYLDANYIKYGTLKNERINYYAYSNLHYLYARSFYTDKMPISKRMDSIINVQKIEFKANWLTYNLYQKALLAITMYRFGDQKFAEKIITSLKESVARNEDYGMYWIENKNGYYWYQSSIETQALLIEAFAEIEKDKTYVDEMKVWLLKQKQLNNWPTTKSTTEAIYALLLQGTDWTSLKDNTKFKIGNEKVLTKKLTEKEKETETGYIKMNWNSNEITSEMGKISVENKSKVAGFGGLYWQYFENLENIKTDSTSTLSITKNLYKKVKTTNGNQLEEINNDTLKVGDLITIRLIIKTDDDLEFVHLKDLRASCFEPIDVLSNYQWNAGFSHYKSTKDVATHFFFDKINKGTYVLEYDVRINNSGNFNDGIATLQSMYAPEFSSHSTSIKVKVD